MYCSKPDTLDKENEDKEQEKERDRQKKTVGRFWLQSKMFFETLTQPILNL